MLIKILKLLNFNLMVSAAFSPNIYIHEAIHFWNNNLMRLCHKMGIHFFNINNYITNRSLDKAYEGFSVHNKNMIDYVHLSNKLGDDFLQLHGHKFRKDINILSDLEFLEYSKDFKLYRYTN